MESKVNGPAIGLMITAGIGTLFALFGIVMAVVSSGANAAMYPEGLEFLGSGIFNILINVISLGVSGFIFWGAMQMKNLESWGMALAANIVAMIPFCGCCIIGLPIGIWGVIVLMNDEVKQAFKN